MTRRIQQIMLVIILVGGCASRESITRRSQLADPLELGPIQVLTKDTTLYELTMYRLADSVLICSGDLKKGNRNEKFSGTLNLTDIVFIQAQHTGFFQSIGAGLMVGAFVVTAASSFDGSGLTVKPTEAFHFPAGAGGGGGSCPYVYSWDGNHFVFEAEAFGVALGKSQEYMSSSLLPSLKEDSLKLKVRIANERPETHYINYVTMDAYDCDLTATPYLDRQNIAWPVYKPEAPIAAVDHSGRNVLNDLKSKDGTYWESDLAQATVDSDLEDMIDLTFVNHSGKKEGTLVVDAINTRFINAIMNYLSGFLGDQYLPFMYATETDSELVRVVRTWMDESSLKAYVWNGQEWKVMGSILAEANAVPFSRVVRFRTLEGNDTVRIRIKALTDVWKLDAFHVDWTTVNPLKAKPARLTSAIGPDGRDAMPVLSLSDMNYVMLLPPQHVDLCFEAVQPAPGKRVMYALNAQGYLYEWMTERSRSVSAMSLAIPAQMKIPYLRKILPDKNLFLPPIYAEWKEQKSKPW